MTREQNRIEALLRAAGHVAPPLLPPPPTRSCEGKRQYGERLARTVAAEQRELSGHNIQAYQCHYCPAWHLGHAPKAAT